MGVVIPCCPDLQPPEDFLDIECITGTNNRLYRVILLSLENPDENSTVLTYQVCRCSGDISHLAFEICESGPRPLENGGDIQPPNTMPDQLPYESIKFDFLPENAECLQFQLQYDEFLTTEDLQQISVTISTANTNFFGTILAPCFDD